MSTKYNLDKVNNTSSCMEQSIFNIVLFLPQVGDGGSKIIKGAGKGVGQIIGGGKEIF